MEDKKNLRTVTISIFDTKDGTYELRFVYDIEDDYGDAFIGIAIGVDNSSLAFQVNDNGWGQVQPLMEKFGQITEDDNIDYSADRHNHHLDVETDKIVKDLATQNHIVKKIKFKALEKGDVKIELKLPEGETFDPSEASLSIHTWVFPNGERQKYISGIIYRGKYYPNWDFDWACSETIDTWIADDNTITGWYHAKGKNRLDDNDNSMDDNDEIVDYNIDWMDDDDDMCDIDIDWIEPEDRLDNDKNTEPEEGKTVKIEIYGTEIRLTGYKNGEIIESVGRFSKDDEIKFIIDGVEYTKADLGSKDDFEEDEDIDWPCELEYYVYNADGVDKVVRSAYKAKAVIELKVSDEETFSLKDCYFTGDSFLHNDDSEDYIYTSLVYEGYRQLTCNPTEALRLIETREMPIE